MRFLSPSAMRQIIMNFDACFAVQSSFKKVANLLGGGWCYIPFDMSGGPSLGALGCGLSLFAPRLRFAGNLREVTGPLGELPVDDEKLASCLANYDGRPSLTTDTNFTKEQFFFGTVCGVLTACILSPFQFRRTSRSHINIISRAA